MAYTTTSGSNPGNRAFQLNGEVLGGVVISGSGFGGLPAYTGSAAGGPVGEELKYTLSKSFADADATGSIIQALNYLKGIQGDASTVSFVEVNNALQDSTGSVYLGDPSRTDNALFFGDLSGTHFSVTEAGVTKIEGLLSASDSLVVDGASIFSSDLSVSGAISSSAGNLTIGGSGFINSLVTTGSISSSAGALIIGGGATLTNTLDVSGAATIAGTTALRGRLNVTGNISGTADVAGQALKIQAGSTITGSSVFHGAISGGLGATFVEGVIAQTLEASSSLLVAGNAGVSGTVDIGGNTKITGSTVFHGQVSGGFGATFVEGVIASTLEASSSIFCGASVVVTGASGFVLATSLQTNQTILASTSITGTTGLNIGGEGLIRIHNDVKEPLLNVSGCVYVSGAASANPIKLQLGQSAASCSLDMIPYIQTMGVDEEGKLRMFKLQISGGMFLVNEA
jgi:hypothetical protein